MTGRGQTLNVRGCLANRRKNETVTLTSKISEPTAHQGLGFLRPRGRPKAPRPKPQQRDHREAWCAVNRAARFDFATMLEEELTPVLPTAALLALPRDVTFEVLSRLDGRALARFSECTNRELAAALTEDDRRSLWASLHQTSVASAEVVPSAPADDDALAFVRMRPALHDGQALVGFDAAACKSAFVRGMSAIEHRCPNCGRRHRSRDGGTPLDDHGRYQTHLCRWFK